MESQDIRWKQRFENFERAFFFLEESIHRTNLNLLELGGLIKAFEFTFELGWKLMKDDLEDRGIDPKSPRETIKAAFSMGIIENGHIWIEMLESRNQFSHTYDFESTESIAVEIRTKYFSAIQRLYASYKNR